MGVLIERKEDTTRRITERNTDGTNTINLGRKTDKQ
jgi:hypothetical protein